MRIVLPALVALGLSACGGWSSREVGPFRVLERELSLGGSWTATVPVAEGDRALLLTVEASPDALTFVESVRDPEGREVYRAQDWWEAGRNKTNGGFSATTTSMNWPIVPGDPPLTPGDWTLRVRSDRRTKTQASVVLRGDLGPDPVIDVETVYVGPLAGSSAIRARIEEAVEVWIDDIYAPLGLTVRRTVRELPGPEVLGAPGFADRTFYTEAVAGRGVGVVSLLLVDTISGVSGILGASGGIPGPLVETDRSVVAISAVESAGADGRFSDEETWLLAETIAHEVGHYLGLFHPAELPDVRGRVDTWDALGDTPECAVFEACTAVLGDNLMFPTPLCAGDDLVCDTYVRQRAVSADQRAVMTAYTGVRPRRVTTSD